MFILAAQVVQILTIRDRIHHLSRIVKDEYYRKEMNDLLSWFDLTAAIIPLGAICLMASILAWHATRDCRGQVRRIAIGCAVAIALAGLVLALWAFVLSAIIYD